MSRIHGKIVRIVSDRGFAFAEGTEDKKDYFVHMKQVRKDSVAFRHFNRGDILEFEPVLVEGKGPQAHDVLLVNNVASTDVVSNEGNGTSAPV